jgi:hypothetical protein
MGLVLVSPEALSGDGAETVELAVFSNEVCSPETAARLRDLGSIPVVCTLPDRPSAGDSASRMPPGVGQIILQYPVVLADTQESVRRLLEPGDNAGSFRDT